MKNDKPKWTLVNGDDWQGLYKDGKLVAEDQSIEVDTFAQHVGIELKEVDAYDYLAADECDGLPENFSDVVLDKD